MIFQLFKPKWQHSNPKIRRQAYETLDPANAAHRNIILERLRDDTDPVLRQWLVKRVSDPAVLQRVAKEDIDAMVRDSALQRVYRMMAGIETGMDSEQRLQLIDSCSDDSALLQTVRQGADPMLRQRAMTKLGRESIYAEVAVDDADADLRMMAAQLLVTPTVMERVVKAAKNKDKRVRTLLQQRLAELIEAAERPTQAYRDMKQLCIKLEAELVWLQTHGDDERVAERVQRLHGSWQDTATVWQQAGMSDDEQLLARYRAASEAMASELGRRAEAAAREREYAATAAARRALRDDVLAQLRMLVERARGWIDPDMAQTQELTATENALVAAWTQHDNDVDGESAAELDRIRDELEQLRAAIPRHAQARQRLMQLIDDIAKTGDGRIESSRAKRWLHERARIESGLMFALNADATAEVDRVFAELGQRVGEQQQQQVATLERFKRGVPELAQLIESGQIKPAQSLAQSLQDIVRTLTDAERGKLHRSALYRQYQESAKKLAQLRDWKDWAAHPIRQRLRDEMTALAEELAARDGDADFDFTNAAQLVQAARKQWNDLGQREGGAESGELWQQFNDACNRAYAPCQAFFDRQAQLRGEHAAAKTALCNELDTFYGEHVADKNPSDIDWRAVNARVRSAYAQWSAIGSVDRKLHGPLSERFRLAVERLKNSANDERERNNVAKEALVERAEQIAAQFGEQSNTGSLAEAIGNIKAIQQEWQHIGPAGKEKALWQRLRTAADHVFSRRQAEFEFQAQVQRASIAERERLVQLMSQLAQLDGAELRAAHVQVQHIKDEWGALAPLARDQAKSWDKRWREACGVFDRALAALARIEAEAARQIVGEQGRLCNRIETALLAAVDGLLDDDALRAAINEQRKAWAFLLDTVEASAPELAERWAAIHEDIDQWLAAKPSERATFAARYHERVGANAETKARVALQTELLFGVESPPDVAAERRELQLVMLAEKMSGKSAMTRPDPMDLLVQWHALGYAGAGRDDGFQDRFSRVATAAFGRG